jgi:hypothetical protein
MGAARVDSAQRTEALGVLTRALDEGRLTLPEYDTRVAAVGSATYVSELLDQTREYGWEPHPFPPPVTAPRNPSAYGRISLILGLVSVPASFCLAGWIFGILAVVYSVRASRAGASGFGAALIGRVFGILGIVLSLGASCSAPPEE